MSLKCTGSGHIHKRPTTYRELERLIESGINYFNSERRSAKINGLNREEYRNKAISNQVTA
ncbi:IS3 family transposase [Lentilactobacillus parabuchneri]|uniref:IS3 family transposase n=1 Tax=Lentilactobacillus parabuchneri TaxID=152331 RepID=UPI003314E17C